MKPQGAYMKTDPDNNTNAIWNYPCSYSIIYYSVTLALPSAEVNGE